MSRVVVLALLTLAAAPAVAQAAAVEVMVVGRDRVLREPTEVRLVARSARVGGRRCAVGARTPLAALLGTRLRVRLRDFGACGRSPRDAGGLFVTQVGPDRNRGRDGWVYKVGRRAGTAGAADPAGAFGTGRGLRGGARVLWFWCRLERAESCQRTLEVRPARDRVAAGAGLPVAVRGYDDAGRGVPAAGATVRLGDVTATTGADGRATLAVPAARGTLPLVAERAGMVRAFTREIRVR